MLSSCGISSVTSCCPGGNPSADAVSEAPNCSASIESKERGWEIGSADVVGDTDVDVPGDINWLPPATVGTVPLPTLLSWVPELPLALRVPLTLLPYKLSVPTSAPC